MCMYTVHTLNIYIHLVATYLVDNAEPKYVKRSCYSMLCNIRSFFGDMRCTILVIIKISQHKIFFL